MRKSGSQLLRRLNCSTQTPRPLGDGPTKGKYNLSDPQDTIHDEDTMSESLLGYKDSIAMEMKENAIVTVGSHPRHKKTIWNDNFNIFKNDIHIIQSLKTLDRVSTSNGKDLKPFWTKQSKDISKKLWLPIKTGCVGLGTTCLNTSSIPTVKGKSWFSMKTIQPKMKNSSQTLYPSSQFSLQNYTVKEVTKNANKKNKVKPEKNQKTLKIRILPTSEEKKRIHDMFGQFRWYYNAVKNIYEKLDDRRCIYSNGSISDTKLRNLVRNYIYSEKDIDGVIKKDFHYDENNNKFPMPPWIHKIIHNRIPRGAIKNFTSNMNSAITNHKNGNIRKYDLKFKTKKDKKQILLFEDGDYPLELKKLKGWYRIGRKKIILSDILKKQPKKPCTIQYDGYLDKWWFLIPVDYDFNLKKVTENQSSSQVISLDPGVRTFQTGYSPQGHLLEIGGDTTNLVLSKHLKRIDYLSSNIDKSTNFKQKSKYKTLRYKVWYKIKNIINDLHWKTINHLTKNYGSIIYPEFNTSEMLKSKKLRRSTKRLMNVYSFYKFKEKLLWKCKQRQRNCYIVDESYTSKTCSSCGYLHPNLGSNKIYKCHNCGIIIDRDINGARNILIKNIM